jgi:DNA-binding transcriptional LysR family regulator
MDVEVRHLRALVAVVEAGSFTGAAAVLHTTQASVSRTIAALERALGARVLHRTTRAVSVTPAGAAVVASARRVLDELAALQRAADRATSDLRVGYAWAALGRHTTAVQRRWAELRPGAQLVFVQSNTPTAGLAEGTVDVGVLRRPSGDGRLRSTLVGTERRYAAVAADDPLARRRSLTLADFAGRTVALDDLTGTTTDDIWAPSAAPAQTRWIRGVDDWLTVIAAGQALGLTAEATAAQHPRPGVVYRRVRDAPPVPVRIAWRSASPPPDLEPLVRLVTELYADGTG